MLFATVRIANAVVVDHRNGRWIISGKQRCNRPLSYSVYVSNAFNDMTLNSVSHSLQTYARYTFDYGHNTCLELHTLVTVDLGVRVALHLLLIITYNVSKKISMKSIIIYFTKISFQGTKYIILSYIKHGFHQLYIKQIFFDSSLWSFLQKVLHFKMSLNTLFSYAIHVL